MKNYMRNHEDRARRQGTDLCLARYKKRRLYLAVFFTLRSVVLYFVIFFKYQVAYKNKFIPVVFQALKNCRQRLWCVIGVVVKQHYRPGADLRGYPFANAVRCRAILPVKTVNIRYKSNVLIRTCAFCINMV